MKYTMIFSLFLISSFNVAVINQQSSPQRIGPEAVWAPGMSIMQDIRQQCTSAGAPVGGCFANGMQKSGASPQAVAFTRLINNDGYARDFREVGTVDIAFVYFPFRANENQGAYLVNGTPNLIDIDDQKLLSKTELEKNPTYTSLAKQYQDITIFPGDRSGTKYLVAKSGPGGGQQFIVDYKLNNMCHACETIGTAKFAFNFDSSGKFLGTKLVSVARAGKVKSS
jgi:hypothetical protein